MLLFGVPQINLSLLTSYSISQLTGRPEFSSRHTARGVMDKGWKTVNEDKCVGGKELVSVSSWYEAKNFKDLIKSMSFKGQPYKQNFLANWSKTYGWAHGEQAS